MLGVASWELFLAQLAKDQLRTCVEVAALTCETTLCSSGDPTSPANQTNAINTAVNLFQGNSILGQSLAGTQLIAVGIPLGPGPGQAQVSFQFLDPVTRSPIQVIGVQGAIIEADGAYCYQPIFGHFLGLSNFTFTVLVSAQAGLPRSDVVICFDLCGAGDDATMVTFIQRFWDYQINPPHIVYMIPWDPSMNNGGGGFAQGMMGNINCDPINPDTANAVPPQNLQQQQLNAQSTCPLQYAQIPPSAQFPVYAVGLAGPSTAPTGAVAAGNLCIGAICSVPNTNKIEIAKHNKRNLISYRSHKGKSGTMSALPSEHANGKPANGQTIVGKPAISANPSTNADIKLCSNTGVNKSNLEDVFVDLKSAKDERSMSSKYTGMDILSFAAPGPAAAPSPPSSSSTGAAGEGNLPNPATGGYILVSNGSFPLSVINTALIPPGNLNTCTNQSTMSYATDTCAGAVPFLGFTDMVQNLDNNQIFGGGTWYGFTYNDLGTVVEAYRGNLESTATAQAAGIDLAALNATPQAGFQADYIQVASGNTQPFNVMKNNLQALLDMVYRVSDVHFGFVAFNGVTGNSVTTSFPTVSGYQDTSVFSKPNWDYYYLPPGVTNNWPIPIIPLNPASGTTASNYNAITNMLPQLHIYGKRDTGVALQAAIDQLDPASPGYSSRSWATKAVVLITDGPPTHDSTSTYNPIGALQEANNQATRAHNLGIPIYVICVNVDTTNGPGIADPAFNETIPGSICNTAGHGSKYYSLVWQDPITTGHLMLNDVGNIARQLNTLLH
jgi:hypothetical protein